MYETTLSKELAITTSEINAMSLSQIDKLAEEKSRFILKKIALSTEKIEYAKENAERAHDMKVGFGGKTKKKVEATANALVDTNEAVAELNEIVRESIRFTCMSVNFAQAMSKYMSVLLYNGFESQGGEIIKLDADSKEQALYIIQQADEFTKRQRAVERQQTEHDTKIAQLSRDISSNASRLNEKDRIDAEQTQRLKEFETLLEQKDSLDESQSKRIEKNEKEIKILYELIKQQADVLDKEWTAIEEGQKEVKASHSKVPLILSILAVISSIASLLLHFLG